MYRTETDRGRVVDLGCRNIERFLPFLQYIRADELDKGLDPVHKPRFIRADYSNARFLYLQRVPVALTALARRHSTDRKAKSVRVRLRQ